MKSTRMGPPPSAGSAARRGEAKMKRNAMKRSVFIGIFRRWRLCSKLNLISHRNPPITTLQYLHGPTIGSNVSIWFAANRSIIMDKTKLIDKINEAISLELGALLQYNQYSHVLTGPERK